jgi:hypothetical protein
MANQTEVGCDSPPLSLDREAARVEPQRNRTWFQRSVGWVAPTYAVLSWPLAFCLLLLWPDAQGAGQTLAISWVVAALWFACAPVGVALGVCATVIGAQHGHGLTIGAGLFAILSSLTLGVAIFLSHMAFAPYNVP